MTHKDSIILCIKQLPPIQTSSNKLSICSSPLQREASALVQRNISIWELSHSGQVWQYFITNPIPKHLHSAAIPISVTCIRRSPNTFPSRYLLYNAHALSHIKQSFTTFVKFLDMTIRLQNPEWWDMFTPHTNQIQVHHLYNVHLRKSKTIVSKPKTNHHINTVYLLVCWQYRSQNAIVETHR